MPAHFLDKKIMSYAYLLNDYAEATDNDYRLQKLSTFKAA